MSKRKERLEQAHKNLGRALEDFETAISQFTRWDLLRDRNNFRDDAERLRKERDHYYKLWFENEKKLIDAGLK